jgi:hypothetical protein
MFVKSNQCGDGLATQDSGHPGLIRRTNKQTNKKLVYHRSVFPRCSSQDELFSGMSVQINVQHKSQFVRPWIFLHWLFYSYMSMMHFQDGFLFQDDFFNVQSFLPRMFPMLFQC